MLKIKDSNDAVYAHYTWSVQNWVYTPPRENANPQVGPLF